MNMLKAGDILSVRIEKQTGTGDGIARADSLIIFVHGGVAGDECLCEITKVEKRAAFGRILRLLVPSDRRVCPDCGLADRCGGCIHRNTDYETERRAKADHVQNVLSRIGHVQITPEEILWEPRDRGYRNKARLYYRDGVLGFCEEGTHVPVGGRCRAMADEDTAESLRKCAETFFNENGLSPDGILLRLSERCPDALVCVVGKVPKTKREALVSALRSAAPRLSGVAVCPVPEKGEALGTGYETLWGSPEIRERLFDKTFTLSPPAFFQVNTKMAEKLYARAGAYAALRTGETVLDLYCGIGSVGLCITPPKAKLFGVEIVPEAIRCARENSKRFGVEGEFLVGDAFKAATELSRRGISPDCVVVDPPRKGLSGDLCDLLCRMAPGRIVYISCDPATLARDVSRLSESYTLEKCTVADLFPGTAHVETVVLLSRA